MSLQVGLLGVTVRPSGYAVAAFARGQPWGLQTCCDFGAIQEGCWLASPGQRGLHWCCALHTIGRTSVFDPVSEAPIGVVGCSNAVLITFKGHLSRPCIAWPSCSAAITTTILLQPS